MTNSVHIGVPTNSSGVTFTSGGWTFEPAPVEVFAWNSSVNTEQVPYDFPLIVNGGAPLGSRLNQIHHRIVAASATADRKFRASLS